MDYSVDDSDELYALASYYAERYNEPNTPTIEREAVLVVFVACLFALNLWHPSAQRLAWSETDPHERIRQVCQSSPAQILQ